MTTAAPAPATIVQPAPLGPLPRALWWKAWVEARLLLAALLVVTALFQVLYVWMSSQVELGAPSMRPAIVPRPSRQILPQTAAGHGPRPPG